MKYVLKEAIKYFRAAHDSINQVRKYTGEPYWKHTEEVAYKVKTVCDLDEAFIAALGHDVIEDVYPKNPVYNLNAIEEKFGLTVVELILSLTDQFTHEAYPELNRNERKNRERERIAGISPIAKTIKLADTISNIRSIAKYDQKFARIYIEEMDLLMPLLKAGNKDLFQETVEIITWAKNKIGDL